MPEAAPHREQCERNANAYQTLGGEQARFLEWPITALVYITARLKCWCKATSPVW